MSNFFKKKSDLPIFILLLLFILSALAAPLLASSKPLFVIFEGELYLPLFRYLLYPGYYTKNVDRFFNLALLFLPFVLIAAWRFPKHLKAIFTLYSLALGVGFTLVELFPLQNPAWVKESARQELTNWSDELSHLSPYMKLNALVDYKIMQQEQEKMETYLEPYRKLLEKRKGMFIPADPNILPTLWNERKERIHQEIERLKKEGGKEAEKRIHFIEERESWLQTSQNKLTPLLMPLIRPYHWEEDRGGNQLLNEVVPWYDLSRINRKDLTAALIFGTRISLVVGFATVFIALCIGIPFGAFGGYYGGTFDIFLSRILEVWEAMPVLFMLLTIVAITEVKSIFWIIITLGIFGWTGFARYVRAETLRIKPLAFVEAARAIGFGKIRTLFYHILPNSLTAVLTLIPFAILAAISSESGLSFLGLGEEGSCSLGVLMDEGRTNFPAESYLLWPPAILLSLLLITIALLNDALRDALDPRLEN